MAIRQSAKDTQFVRGAEKLSRRIRTIAAAMTVGEVTEDIAALLLRRTLNRFDREVDPDERPWAELAPPTILRRAREGYGGKGKLRRTDSLRNSIRVIRGSAAGAVYTNTGARSRIGISDPEQIEKAAALNRGTRTIPARRFLGIGRLDIRSVDAFLRRRAANLEKDLLGD